MPCRSPEGSRTAHRPAEARGPLEPDARESRANGSARAACRAARHAARTRANGAARAPRTRVAGRVAGRDRSQARRRIGRVRRRRGDVDAEADHDGEAPPADPVAFEQQAGDLARRREGDRSAISARAAARPAPVSACDGLVQRQRRRRSRAAARRRARRGRSRSRLAWRLPGGEAQARPCRPRPARCSCGDDPEPARIAVAGGRARASSLVEPVVAERDSR